MGALDGIRVLDFGHYVAGPVLGMLFADQGAQVVKIDPPGGPVFATPANATWNRGKKSLCLDLKAPADRAIAADLASRADVLLENFRPGVMQRLGLDEAALRERNPGLVYASMPAFAPEDPRSAMQGWEGIVLAATDVLRPIAEYRGLAQLLSQEPREREGTPVFTAEPIASMYAALLSAVHVTAALKVRAQSGRGQRVEIPLFDAMLQALGVFGMSRVPWKPITGSVFSGLDHQYECKDGRWVHIVCTRPRHGERFLRAIGRGDLADLGAAEPGAGADPARNGPLTAGLIEAFRTRTGEEWEDFLIEHELPGAMCRSSEEWLDHPHARQSDLLTDVEDPILGPMRQPGLQVKLSGTPGGIQGPAPRPDEHRAEILRSLETPHAPRAAEGGPIAGFPFAGLRVLDLCIVLAGPTCGRTLAELGADVIKIDDPNRGEVSYHHDINRGKRTILLDLKQAGGLEIFWELVDRADVIVQNYRQGVVERLGIDYASVRARKPDIVYASLNAYGDTGPWAKLPGYEESAQALTGIQTRFGGDAKPILWPYGVINDYGTGYSGAYGVLMALLERNRTGQGQHVTAALARTACILQSAHLQQYAGKRWTEPRGPAALGFSPWQRLYECNDGWLYVGARDRAALESCVGAAAGDDALAARATDWCAQRSRAKAIAGLAAEGVAAHELTWLFDLMASPAAVERGLSVTRDHEKLGALRTTGPGPWYSGSRIHAGVPAPLPGRDAASVLSDIGRESQLQSLLDAGLVTLPDIA